MTARLRHRWMCLVTIILAISGLPTPLHAEDPVKELVKKVEAKYKKTTDLTAEFTQTTTVKGFTKAIKSAGRVYIKRPGKLRWDYLDPSLEQIFVDNDRVKFYVPEHKQVLTGQLSKMASSQAPLHLLQGIGKLETHYLVTPTPNGEKGDGGLPLLALTPLKGGPEQPRVVAEVDAKSFLLRRVELHDVNGNISNFLFSNVRTNTGMKDDVFAFTVPPDVEVVDAPTLASP